MNKKIPLVLALIVIGLLGTYIYKGTMRGTNLQTLHEENRLKELTAIDTLLTDWSNIETLIPARPKYNNEEKIWRTPVNTDITAIGNRLNVILKDTEGDYVAIFEFTNGTFTLLELVR